MSDKVLKSFSKLSEEEKLMFVDGLKGLYEVDDSEDGEDFPDDRGKMISLLRNLRELLEFQEEPSELFKLLLGVGIYGHPKALHTDLTLDEIMRFAIIDAISDNDSNVNYPCPVLRSFGMSYRIGKLSHKRQSRQEMVRAVKEPDVQAEGIRAAIGRRLDSGRNV